MLTSAMASEETQLDDDLAIVNLERVKRISDTFKPTKTKKKGSVPRNVVEEVWRGRLTPRFFLRLINVMFPEDAREVSFLSFYTIYKNLAEPETEIMFRALTIYYIATIHEPPFNYEQANEYPNASYKSIKDYICDVVTSYLHAAIHIHMKEALGWANLKATNSLIDGNLAASYILKDLETHRNEVSIGGLEVWLEKNEIYYTVSEQLYLFLFGVNKSIDVKPLLPFPDVHASKGLNTILAMTDVLLLNSKLPKRAQRWSLAYIMDTQSNDWESFKQAIYGKRQTIIVIQDANGDIFGMYCPQQWVPSEGFYGSDESFLFTLKPDVNIYDSSGRDNHYQLFTDFGIGMGGTLTDPGLFINWSLRVGTTARRCSTYGKYLPLSRDLVFDIRLLELWVVNEALKQKWKSSSRDFYSTVVMWNRIGQNKAKTPQSLQKKLNSDSNVCHEFQKDNVRGKKKVMNREQHGWCHCSKSNCKESTVEIDELGSQEKQSLENFNQTIQEKNNQALKLQKKTFKSFGDSSISHILSDHLPMTPQRTVVLGMSHHELHNPQSPDGDKNEYQHTYPHPIYNRNTTEMSLTMEPLHRSDSMGHNVTHRQTVQIVEPPESSHNETSAMNQQNMSIYEPQPHLSRATEVSQRGLSVFQPPSPMQRASATSQRGMSVFVPPSRASRASAVSQRGLSMIEPTHQTTRPSALSQQAKSAYVAPQQSTTSQLNMSTYEPIPQTARDWEIDQGRMSFFQTPHVQEMLRAPTQGQSGISVYEQAPVIAANSNPFTSIDFTKQDHQYDLNVNPSEERMQMSGRQSQAYHGEPPAVSGESLEYNNRQSPPTVHHMNARSPSRAVVPAVSNIRAPSPSGYKQTAGRDTSCRLCTCGGKRQCMICYCPKENMANMCTCGGNEDQKDSRGGACEQNLQIHKGKAKRRSKSKASDKAAKKEAKKREREEKRALKQEKKERKAKDREIRKLSKKSTSVKRKKHGRGKGQHWSPCDCCKCEENAICPCRGQTSSECSDQQKKGCCGRKKKLKKSKKIEKAPNKSKECEDVENKPNEAAGDDQQYCSFPDTPCPGLAHAKEFCECSPYDDRNSCNPSGAIPTRKYGLSVGGQCGDGRQASPSSQRLTVAFAREAENGICNRINCLKNKQSCDCYTTKGICNCNCTSKIRSDPQVFSSLMPPLSVGKGDSQYKFIRNSSQPQFTTLPTTVTPSGNLIINVTKKGGPMGLTNNGENKHFVPPCVLYLDCTKVKDMCVIIRNNQDSPSFPNDSV